MFNIYTRDQRETQVYLVTAWMKKKKVFGAKIQGENSTSKVKSDQNKLKCSAFMQCPQTIHLVLLQQ
jgi:hypothetical protein